MIKKADIQAVLEASIKVRPDMQLIDYTETGCGPNAALELSQSETIAVMFHFDEEGSLNFVGFTAGVSSAT